MTLCFYQGMDCDIFPVLVNTMQTLQPSLFSFVLLLLAPNFGSNKFGSKNVFPSRASKVIQVSRVNLVQLVSLVTQDHVVLRDLQDPKETR